MNKIKYNQPPPPQKNNHHTIITSICKTTAAKIYKPNSKIPNS